MRCRTVYFSRHAITRMFERGISQKAALAVLQSGETLMSYPDDEPYPSRLLLGWCDERLIHVVVARNPDEEVCYIITVYEPSDELWGPDYKERKA